MSTTAPPSPADPRSFIKALGSRPSPFLIQQAQLALSRIESDLSRKLNSLLAASSHNNNINSHTDNGHPVSTQEEASRALREEAEREKLPYKSIISLSELHQIYEGLINSPDERTMKTLEILNSFSQRNHMEKLDAQCDLAKVMLEAAQKQSMSLDLSGRSLQSLPTSFGPKLQTLVSLDLSKNQLEELPSSIGELQNVETLHLQSNQIELLPDSIGFLKHLKILNVSGNMLMAVPESIGGCRNLVELKADFNQLQCLPARIGYDLISLQVLSLHSNKLTILPPSLCKLKCLKILDLHFNNIKSLPPNIDNLSALERLDISNNFSDFGGALPETIGDLGSLQELDLSFNQVRVLPDALGAISSRLKVLKVDNNPLVIPPLEVVQHSAEAVMGYMVERWKSSQACHDEEGYSFTCPSPMRSSHGNVKLSCYNWRVKGSGLGASSLVQWLVGRCAGGKLPLRHKRLN